MAAARHSGKDGRKSCAGPPGPPVDSIASRIEVSDEMADPHQRRMASERWVSYRGGMDYFLDSIQSGAEESDGGRSTGALLAFAVILGLAAASAGVLVASGWFLVGGA